MQSLFNTKKACLPEEPPAGFKGHEQRFEGGVSELHGMVATDMTCVRCEGPRCHVSWGPPPPSAGPESAIHCVFASDPTPLGEDARFPPTPDGRPSRGGCKAPQRRGAPVLPPFCHSPPGYDARDDAGRARVMEKGREDRNPAFSASTGTQGWCDWTWMMCKALKGRQRTR
jgi:hypothetical protein